MSDGRRRGWVLLALAVVGLLVLLLRYSQRPGASDEPDGDARGRSLLEGLDRGELAREPMRLGLHGRLEGSVLDHGDGSIAGAQVCLSPADPTQQTQPGWRPRCVTADDAGRFVIDTVAPGRHQLTAAARGYVPAPVIRGPIGLVTTVAAGQLREGLILRLRPGGAEVRGIVRDITGGTVAGARVFSETAMDSTDDDGRFSLWLDARSFVELQVSAEGYATASLLEWRPIGRELEVLLRPEVVLAGRVVTADQGEGVAGVAVLARAPQMLGYSGSFSTQRQVRTDADGRFRFTGLGPGRYKPEVRSGSWRGLARESVLLVLGDAPEDVEIRVHPARQLGGRVIRADSGDACDSGQVSIHDGAGVIVDRMYADPSGAVAVGGLLPGTYSLEIKCDESEQASTLATVDLAEQDLLDAVWEVEAPSGQAIRGRVVDSSGHGIALADVWAELYEAEDERTSALGRAVTEADGTFEMFDLPPGVYRFFRVEAEGMASPRDTPEVTLARDRDTEDFEIVLPRAGALRVRVRDPSGSPVPDTTIMVKLGLGGTLWKSTPESEWLIDPLAAGVYVIEAKRPGVGGRAGPGDPDAGEAVEVVAGQTAELTLLAPARKGTIQGIVRTHDGDLVADAAVWALGSEVFVDYGGRDRQPEFARTVSDIDGRFTLAQLETGTYTIRARDTAGIEQARDNVASGATDVSFELPSDGALAGSVTVRSGDPPARFTISIKPVDGGRGRSEEFLFTEGQWRVVGLPPGTIKVGVEAAEGTDSKTVTIPEGGELDGVILELAARGTLRGRLIDAETREGVAGYLTSVIANGHASGLDPEGDRYTDAEGRFELRGVPSGAVSLRLWAARARARGYDDSESQITVEAGGTTDVGDIPVARRTPE